MNQIIKYILIGAAILIGLWFISEATKNGKEWAEYEYGEKVRKADSIYNAAELKYNTTVQKADSLALVIANRRARRMVDTLITNLEKLEDGSPERIKDVLDNARNANDAELDSILTRYLND